MVNSVVLIGKLGKDAVIKHFQNDSAIAEFSLATSDNYKDKEGKWVDVTDWHNVKVSGNAKFMEFIEKRAVKGANVYISGKLKTRSYDDKDGNKRYVTEVVSREIKFLDKQDSSNNAGAQNNNSNSNTSSQDDDDSGLPF